MKAMVLLVLLFFIFVKYWSALVNLSRTIQSLYFFGAPISSTVVPNPFNISCFAENLHSFSITGSKAFNFYFKFNRSNQSDKRSLIVIVILILPVQIKRRQNLIDGIHIHKFMFFE